MTTACTKLMIIRHAEKPDKPDGIKGVSEDGGPDEDSLSVLGWQRAGALVRFFAPDHPAVPAAGLAVPGALYAGPPTKEHPSKRPVNTIAPLAAALGLPLCTDFALHHEKALIAAAQEAAPVVLICWHHEHIPKLAEALGVAISDWPDAVFDRVLVFDRDGPGWTMRVVRQHLLPGDS